MATPHVTGVAALAFSYQSGATYAQVREAILGGVDADAALVGKTVTGGRLNAYNTLVRLSQAPTLTAPAAPSSLTAAATSKTAITLSWVDNASNEDGFVVQRSRDQANWTTIATLGPAAGTGATVRFTNSGLARRTRYYYRVRAYNAAGSSPYTNTATAVTQ